MSTAQVPKPPVALNNICSVIYANTLYTYSADAFQSISLEPGAAWKTLSNGVPVKGGVCVGSTPVAPREPGFFVVGGQGPDGYKGLQKFTYKTGQWETMPPVSADITNRLYHGAAYINTTDSIVVYGGSQDGSQNPSSQTFTIGASAPFDVQSFESAGAPPSVYPMLLPWSANQVALAGGEGNTKVFLFSPEAGGWRDSGATLASALPHDVATKRSAIIAGADGTSKMLYTFDTSQSPVKVTRSILVDRDGQPVVNSQAISARSETVKDDSDPIWRLIERQADSWPSYNSTFAPKSTRTNFALAQNANGMVVMAGGSEQNVMDIFNGRENKWVDAASVFNNDRAFKTLDVDSTSSSASPSPSATPSSSSSSSSTPSSTATSSTSSTAASSSSEPTLAAGAGSTTASTDSSSSGPPINAILGAVLGTTAAILLLLGILYCLLRRKKRRAGMMEAGNLRRDNGTAANEKGGITYAADSLPDGPNGASFRGHQQQDSQASFSSMAILMGKVNQQKQAGVQRNPSKETKRSSGGSILNSAFKKSISKPMPQQQSPNPFSDPTPPAPESQPRDEKNATVYFSSDVAEPRLRPNVPDRADGPRRSSGWNRYWSGGSTLNILGFGSGASKRTTMASDTSSHYSSSAQTRGTQESAVVPPLVMGGSTTRLPMTEPKPEFQRVNSGSPTISSSPHLGPGMKGRIERPASTGSDRSGYSSGVPSSVQEAWDPTIAGQNWGANRAPSSAYNYTSAYNSMYSTALAPPSNPGSLPKSGLPSGVSTQPQLSMAASSSDMSWLNLGDDRNRRR